MFGDPVENPKGWEIATLGEVARNEDGRRVPLKKADRDQIDGIYPYYGASGIIDYVDDYIFDGPRLLIGEDGANLVARSTPVAFIAEGKYWVNNHAHVLAYSGSASLIFLRDLVNLIDLKPYITGTAQPKLNQKQLNRIKVPIPPMDLQERYCLIVSAVEKQRINSIKQIDELQALFSCLQGRAFMGQL
nr:restriction endonuclease subunit S [Wenzhouxiangella limi]